MKTSLLLIAGLALVPAGCTAGFGRVPESASFKVDILQKDPNEDPTGAPKARLPITFTTSRRFTVRIEAKGANGARDSKFDGYVRVSTKPGTIASMSGQGVRGRNVQMKDGLVEEITVDLVAAYGDTRIWVEELGYTPSDALGTKPRCSDGQDNDDDGRIDFPADPGCAFADDDTENPGSLATGASETIYYAYPRIADVRGVDQGGSATPFPKEQVQIDTGYDRAENKFNHSVVVTRIASDGFYITDIDDPRGYASVFAYTFNPPARLAVCDRLSTASGTATDFFGFTELAFPAWSVEERVCSAATGECNRPCLVPEPRVLTVQDLTNLKAKLAVSAALVRVETKDNVELRVAKHFGKNNGRRDGDTYVFADDASNCDFNASGRVDFTQPDEAACSNSCDRDPECTEWSAWVARSDVELVLEAKGAERSTFAKIQSNASSAPDFDPLARRGQPLRAFSGTLRYFSGGSQFTIEARCQDDIVTDLAANPKSSEGACVFPRLDTDNNVGAQ